MQNGANALSSIFFAGQGLLVQMFITLESHHIFGSNWHTFSFFAIGREMIKKRKKKYK